MNAKKLLLSKLKILKYHMFYSRRYYIFEKCLDKISQNQSIEKLAFGAEYKLAEKPEDINMLFKKGYDLGLCPYSGKLEEKLKAGAKVIFIFIGRKAVHVTWLFTGAGVKPFDEVFERYFFEGVGYIGPCVTDRDNRGKGLYRFALSKACSVFYEREIKKAMICSSTKNIASQKGIEGAGFRRVKEFVFIRFMFVNYFFFIKKAGIHVL